MVVKLCASRRSWSRGDLNVAYEYGNRCKKCAIVNGIQINTRKMLFLFEIKFLYQQKNQPEFYVF